MTDEGELEVLPLSVAICFSHAAVQYVADLNGIDVLHIKGPAVPEELLASVDHVDDATDEEAARRTPRQSHDADVLVRPAQAWALIRAMESVGWSLKHRFDDDSVFGHAATMVHNSLGYLDVHRRLPGMDREPERAFDSLFKERSTRLIAEYPCSVPCVAGHRLILLLNAGRSGRGDRHPDIARAWLRAADDERLEVERLARDVHADAAFAAITGRTPLKLGAEFELWRLLSRGHERSLRFVIALIRAQPGLISGARTVLRLARLHKERVTAARDADLRPCSIVSSLAAKLRRDVLLSARDLRRIISRTART